MGRTPPLNSRPILWALVFLVYGIVLGRVGDIWLVVGILLGVFFCAMIYFQYRYLPVILFIALMLVGVWRVSGSLHSHTVEPIPTVFEGVVIDVAGYTAGGNLRVFVRGAHPETFAQVRVLAFVRPHQARVAVGQEVVLGGTLQPLRTAANPGGYCQFRHLRPHKVDAVIFPNTLQAGEVRLSFMTLLRQFRDRVATVYAEVLPPREAGIIMAMVLGDNSELDNDLRDIYRAAGIFHILSISGLHVTILMMALYGVLGFVMSERRAGIVSLVVMVLYCLLTGAAVATVRAVTMGGVLVMGRVFHRDYDLLASVSLACIALLIYEPLWLYTMGFQLSFGAVYGMGLLTAPFSRALMMAGVKLKDKTRNNLGAGLAAVISTYPIFMFHLSEIQTYSFFGNLVIAPTASLILVVGVLVGILGLLWMPIASLLAGVVYYILQFYELTGRFFYSLPFAFLLTGGGSLIVVAAAFLVLFLFRFAFSCYGEGFRRRVVLLFCGVLVFVFCVWLERNPRGVEITLLHSAGEYAVLRHRGDVLVIGNGRGGEGVLLDYLDRIGVRRVDGFLFSGGGDLSAAMNAIMPRVRRIYLPLGFENALLVAERHGVAVVYFPVGSTRAVCGVVKYAETSGDLRVEFGGVEFFVNAREVRVGEDYVFDTGDGRAVRLRVGRGGVVRMF